MKKTSFLLIILFFTISCKDELATEKHIFYLHGRIIELQGPNAVSEQYGPYQYQAIIDTLKTTGAIVHHEVRTETTDFDEFSQKISNEIDALIKKGISPVNISVIGASKGALMAMNISDMNKTPINYILLGSNSDQTESQNNWVLHGNILAFYEESDQIAGKSYQYWINQKNREYKSFKQIKLETGLGHGFLYRPIDEWVKPTKAWIQRDQFTEDIKDILNPTLFK